MSVGFLKCPLSGWENAFYSQFAYAERSGRSVAEFKELMSLNNGNGRWLSPEEAKDAGLIDTIIGSESESSQRKGVVGIVSDLFRLGRKGEEHPTLLTDHNILHNPLTELQTRRSAIALDEGQRAVKPSAIKSVEDPGIDDGGLSSNAAAYNRDATNFHRL